MASGHPPHPEGDPIRADRRKPEVLAELMTRVARDHDRDAFAELFRHFAPRLRSFFLRGGMTGGSAEDLAQEVMLRMWHRAGQFDPSRASLSAWVYAMAQNLRADMRRRERRTPVFELPQPQIPEVSPDAAAIYAQEEDRLRKALHSLTAAQREAVRSAYFEELTQSEAQQALGIAQSALKSRLRLALIRLRKVLGESLT